MARSSFNQAAFTGGKFGKQAQGRFDLPDYHKGMGECLNGQPLEVGAWQRRSGTQIIIPTRSRNYAKLRPFESNSAVPYIMEFTDSCLRFISGTTPIFTNDWRTVTAADRVDGFFVLTLDDDHGWANDDDVMLWFPDEYPAALECELRGRVLQITDDGTTDAITVGDERGNTLLASTTTAIGMLVGAKVMRMLLLDTPYTEVADIAALRSVQSESSVFMLSSAAWPREVKMTVAAAGAADPTFTIAEADFQDGPYLDTQGGNVAPETGTLDALTGNVTFTPASTTPASTDVGRHIRFHSSPPAWDAVTSFVKGDLVMHENEPWEAINSGAYAAVNVNVKPGTAYQSSTGVAVQLWSPAPEAPRWAWGKITAAGMTTYSVTLETDLPTENGLTVDMWQLGLFRSSAYPTCGTFHEGRLWLAGASPNRFDASMSSKPLTFSPTDEWGNVNDDSAISETFNSPDASTIYWMMPDQQGVVMGTLKGEWLVHASTLTDPITPTTIQGQRVTKYGCANIEPKHCGMALVFVQRYSRRAMEYLSDGITGRYTGKHLNEYAYPGSKSGIAEIAYQEEPTPVIWYRTNDGRLEGHTYRRVSRYVSEAPVIAAWHSHVIGPDRIVEAICSNADPGGGAACLDLSSSPTKTLGLDPLGDRLYLVTNDPVDGDESSSNRLIEIMNPLLAEDEPNGAAWTADTASGQMKHFIAENYTSTDAVCTPLGGATAADDEADTDLGSRATTAPDTTIPASGTTRDDILSALRNAVYFNGYSALDKLPRMTNSTTLSMSWWINLGGGPDGCILSTPQKFYKHDTTNVGTIPGYSYSTKIDKTLLPILDTSPDAAIGRTVYVSGLDAGVFGATAGYARLQKTKLKKENASGHTTVDLYMGMQITQVSGGDYDAPAIDFGSTAYKKWPDPWNSGDSGPFIWGPTFSGNVGNAADRTGWKHCMLSLKIEDYTPTAGAGTCSTPTVSGSPTTWPTLSQVKMTFWINDTEIGTDVGLDEATCNPSGSGPLFDAAWHLIVGPDAEFPFHEFTDWAIGGRNTNARDATDRYHNIPTEESGEGMVGCVTELWIAPGQFIDWSSEANRKKFHCKDALETTYAPVDIGIKGDTPTGVKPAVYCTGDRTVFHVNRAKKKASLRVHNNYPDDEHRTIKEFGPVLLDACDEAPPT